MLSLLLVEAERPGALRAALDAQPDALVLDLGAPDGAGERGAARHRVVTALAEASRIAARPRLLVRIAPLDGGLLDADLAAVVEAGAEAVLAPGIVGARDLGRLGAKLAVAEARCGRVAGAVGILAGAGDTARGILALPSLAEGAPRLVALGYDSAGFGEPGSAAAVAARGALVLAALAAGVPAIDLGPLAPRGRKDAPARAHRDGFAGRLVRAPEEVAVVGGEVAPEAGRE